METLVLVAHSHHKNHYYGRVKPHAPPRFSSYPSRANNCRTFQSSHGILPSPSKANSPSPSFKPTSNSPSLHTTAYKPPSRTSPIPINVRAVPTETALEGDLSFSELWAGPAYSISPPPTSLPIPKFSMRPKRTVSLDFPASDPTLPLHPIAKSAPASPTRGCADSATKTLRRILNLDVLDE